jgi:hypothetical protein
VFDLEGKAYGCGISMICPPFFIRLGGGS